MRPVWIGIDLGTQSVRVLALDDEGSELAGSAVPVHSVRDGKRHEQDPREWLAAVVEALSVVVAALPAGAAPRALAVSGTSGTLVPVDAVTGEPRGAAIMYDDRRGSGHLDRVVEAGAAVWERLGYRMQASWALPKIAALRPELPEGAVFAHQPDVVTSMLAGRLLASDLSSALKSGVDLDTGHWPADVLDALGVPVARLNAVAASGTVVGAVGAEGAARTGLPEGCLIVAGMTDGCAAQIGAGALAPGSWNAVLGTTLVVKGASRERRPDRTGAVYAHRAPFDGGWYPGGASSTGARAISVLLPGRDLAELTQRVAAGASAPPVAYPLLGRGERFPFVAAEAVGDLPEGADDVTLLSAILHGVAFVERLGFDLLAATGYDISGPLLFTGGGSRNPWWNQLRADVLQREVRVPAQSEGAAGMAMLAAAGFASGTADRLPASDAPPRDPLALVAARMTSRATRIEPRRSRREPLWAGYSSFVEHLDAHGWLEPELARAARERMNA